MWKIYSRTTKNWIRAWRGLYRAVTKRRGPGIFPGYYERGPRLLSKENGKKIERKEIPSCLILRLLFVFAWQLEILVTTLIMGTWRGLWVSTVNRRDKHIMRMWKCKYSTVSGLDMYHCVTALFWVPDGMQKVGRSRTTWRRTTEREKAEAGWGYWDQ